MHSMRDIVVYIPARKCEDTIGAVIAQWIDRLEVATIKVCSSPHRWSPIDRMAGPDRPNDDRSVALCKDYGFPSHVEFMEADWVSETAWRMWVLEDAKYRNVLPFYCDADEMYTNDDWTAMMSMEIPARIREREIIGCRSNQQIYMWDLTHIFTPPDPWTPCNLITHPQMVTMDNRSPIKYGIEYFAVFPGTMYHLSWIGPLERLRWKLNLTSHYGIIRDELKTLIFRESTWPWDHKINVGPYPGRAHSLTHSPLPNELWVLLKRWQTFAQVPPVLMWDQPCCLG